MRPAVPAMTRDTLVDLSEVLSPSDEETAPCDLGAIIDDVLAAGVPLAVAKRMMAAAEATRARLQ